MADLAAQLAEAARDGMEQMLLYRTASGAWDCTARRHGKARVVIGHAVLRTPDGAVGTALAEFARETAAPPEACMDSFRLTDVSGVATDKTDEGVFG